MGSLSFKEDVVILMVPFPLQGHLNQLLHLSRLVSAYNIPVHFVAATARSRQARRRIHGWDPLSTSNLIFHKFPSICFHFTPPPPEGSTAPIQPPFDGSAALRQPVAELLSYLCATTRRVVVIYDSLMGSVVQDFVKFSNAEAYTFHSVSAYTIFFFLWENKGRPFGVDPGVLEKLPSLDGCFTPEFTKFIRNQHKYLSLNSGRIYNSSRVVENTFLELLSKPEISGGKAQWALGPFNPLFPDSGGADGSHKCLKWLDRQAPNSVIFVSFGTSTTLTKKQIHELAAGLESSEEKFIWVLRDADDEASAISAGEIKNQALPVGFEERVKERGMIVRDWAPQLGILGHPASGGFLSHCGWNSCMESISMGVPIAAWPMHSDQPRNTVLVTEVLRIGIVVRDWNRRGVIVTSSEVETSIRRLMASEEGEGMRRRAAELGGSVRKAVAEGGATRLELDSFITHITR